MVIVEGPDGSGKSTLVQRLSEELKVEVRPRACTSDNGVDPATLREWVDQDLGGDTQGLYDRHPLISEPIYGPIIRGRMAEGFADPEWLSMSLSMLRQRTSIFIFCLPPWPAVRHNVIINHKASTPHLKGVLKHSEALYEMYVHRAAVEAQLGFTWVWDYTHEGDYDMSFDRVLQLCREVLR